MYKLLKIQANNQNRDGTWAYYNELTEEQKDEKEASENQQGNTPVSDFEQNGWIISLPFSL